MLMDHFMKENLKMISLMDKATIVFLEEKNMKENSKMENSKDMEYNLGLITEDMKVNLKIVCLMEKE